jgi:chloramphenicol-sensitive protein RarD
MSQRRGYAFAIGAYVCWGVFPIYWKLMRPSSALEILAHRIFWSAVVMALIIAVVRGWSSIGRLLRDRRRVALIATAATVLSVNWGTYIYGVNAARVVETSLGYFINPLVTVLLGVFVLRERLRPAQWAAIGVGTLAVAVLTVDYGHVPYLALILAVSFGCYGLIKKRLAVPAKDGLFLESATLALPALAYLGVLRAAGESTFGRVSPSHTALLVLGGLVTAIPLLLFAGAANRIPLSAIGLLQYIAPVLQLGCGVLIYHEPMSAIRWWGFGLVWTALAVFSWDGIRHARARSRAAGVAVAAAAASV